MTISDTAAPLSRPPYILTAATLAAILGVLAIAFWPRATTAPKSEIRVHNASSIPLYHVVVNHMNYGDIPAGASTPYKSWGPAYSKPYVTFEAGGAHLRHIPIDHVGESVLGTGKFAFIINVDSPKSEVDFSVDVANE